MDRRVICTLSGGFDSAATLLWALENHVKVEALFVTYGQRYERQERRAVVALVQQPAIGLHPHFGGLRSISADMLLMPPGNPWIPYRNLIIAAHATNVAASIGAQEIIFGSKSMYYRPSDPISYMDSTVAFYTQLEDFIRRFTEPRNQHLVPTFNLPMAGWEKKEVLKYLHEGGVDLHKLWNCYREDENPEPCGVCEHCVITQPLIIQVLGEAKAKSDATGTA